MTYLSQARKAGRTPVTIVEIDVYTCENKHGEAPCNAQGIPCFNTFSTCQDLENWNRGVKTLRLITKENDVPLTINAIPCVDKVTFESTEINDSKPFSKRAKVTVKCHDFPHHDRGFDPYVARRNYIPISNGTFWGKFIARNRFIENRFLRVKTGYITENGIDFNNFDAKTYVVESISGSTQKGYTIVAKDILKLAEDKRAQCPAVSTATLPFPVTKETAIIGREQLSGLTEQNGYVLNVGSELIRFRREGNLLVITERGAYSTSIRTPEEDAILEIERKEALAKGEEWEYPIEHEQGDKVQECAILQGKIHEVVKRLLVDYASIDEQYIDDVSFRSESETWLSDYNVSAIIAKPTGVTKLLKELCEQCLFSIYVDDRDNLIKIKAITPRILDDCNNNNINISDESNLIRDSISIKRSNTNRINACIIYYGQINPLKNLDDLTNYKYPAWGKVDGKLISENAHGDIKFKTIYSRWFDYEDLSAVQNTAAVWVKRLSDGVTVASFTLDAKDSNFWTSDNIRILTDDVVNTFGFRSPDEYMITYAQESETGHRYKYRAIKTHDKNIIPGRYGLIAPNTTPDYLDASDDERCRYAFIADDTTCKMSNGDDEYIFL